MARMGRLRGRVTEAELKDFLEKSSGGANSNVSGKNGAGGGGYGFVSDDGGKGRVVFCRRAREDDDLDLDLELDG